MTASAQTSKLFCVFPRTQVLRHSLGRGYQNWAELAVAGPAYRQQQGLLARNWLGPLPGTSCQSLSSSLARWPHGATSTMLQVLPWEYCALGQGGAVRSSSATCSSGHHFLPMLATTLCS